MESQNTLQKTMCKFLREYISRQGIVFDALKELQPSFFRLAQAIGDKQKFIQLLKEYTPDSTPGIGYWGKEENWRYFIHGSGCQLVHTVSGEPIEWDMPDLLSFDAFWFTNWLKWLLNHDHQDNALNIIRTSLNGFGGDLRAFTLYTLGQLEANGLIVHSDLNNHNKYALADEISVSKKDT